MQKQSESALGIGSYTAPEAARLLKIPPRNIRRWLNGYEFRKGDVPHYSEPLWIPDLAPSDDHLELSFRDLMELRFVHAFTKAGLGLKTIRYCLAFARELAESDRPFSTRKFRTDGNTIFLETESRGRPVELLDLRRRQYAFKIAIEQTFRDLDIEDGAVARWRPFNGKRSIVVDPTRSFGQPIVTDYGVPTATLADAVAAEGSPAAAARLYEVPMSAVKDALLFEQGLKAA